MQQEEIWKDIPDYEGFYQASNLGRIKRLQSEARVRGNGMRVVPERICKQHLAKNGYMIVSMSKDGIVKMKSVHRLIAKTFLPNPDRLPEVNHCDECKTNNVVSNLEWCSKSYNLSYGTRIHRILQHNEAHAVKCYTTDGNIVGIFNTAADASRVLKFPKGTAKNIKKCCQGKIKTAYGYKWEYV